MMLDAFALLDHPIPKDVAARLFGCQERLFRHVAAADLTLARAFQIALTAARADLSHARERRRKLRAARKAKICAAKRKEA